MNLELLKKYMTDFNWVNPEESIVVIGTPNNIGTVEIDRGSGIFSIYSEIELSVCRTIMGEIEKDVRVFDSSAIYRDLTGEIKRNHAVGQPWITANSQVLIIARPAPYKTDDDAISKAPRYFVWVATALAPGLRLT